jgi:hypothetical protein
MILNKSWLCFIHNPFLMSDVLAIMENLGVQDINLI